MAKSFVAAPKTKVQLSKLDRAAINACIKMSPKERMAMV